MRTAFAVPDGDVDMDQPPASAEQYLMMVR